MAIEFQVFQHLCQMFYQILLNILGYYSFQLFINIEMNYQIYINQAPQETNSLQQSQFQKNIIDNSKLQFLVFRILKMCFNRLQNFLLYFKDLFISFSEHIEIMITKILKKENQTFFYQFYAQKLWIGYIITLKASLELIHQSLTEKKIFMIYASGIGASLATLQKSLNLDSFQIGLNITIEILQNLEFLYILIYSFLIYGFHLSINKDDIFVLVESNIIRYQEKGENKHIYDNNKEFSFHQYMFTHQNFFIIYYKYKKSYNNFSLIIIMQKQDTPKYINSSKLFCELHSDFQLIYILLEEKVTRKSRMLCAKCMIDIIANQEKVTRLVCLQDFMKNPQNCILKATKDEKDDNEALSEIEKQLIQLEDSIKNQIIIIRQNLQQMRQSVGSITTELSLKLKLNDIVKQFELVNSMDSYQGTDELKQLDEQLNQISANLIKTYSEAKEKFKDNQQLIVNNVQNNLKIVQNEIDSVSKTSFLLLSKIINCGIPYIIYDDLYQFPQIHQQISEGKQIQYQLLYQGTRDGLNGQTYWAKCNGQSNLLTIMTSKNGQKFGVYSPCTINNGLSNWVQDPSMKSFIFQYNKKEIYKLKNQSYAQYCHASYGPTFGGGHDLHIAADFNSGQTNLGHSYDIAGQNVVDASTHIFGQKTPQLQECKVYKVIFQ
ncbi:hypothetical protein pb186bvf_003078 [Paramecium bursaria]